MPRFIVWLQFLLVVWHWAGVGNPSVRAVPVKKEGLYSIQDDVIILNHKNMKDRVYGKSKVWVIEFYNSWCGHCIHFAPTWRQFASDLKGWRRVVSVGAIDCANNYNLEICREFDIEAYPSIMMLPPHYSSDTPSKKVKRLNSQDKLEMKDSVLDYITNPEFPVPPTWPRLTPLGSVGDIWEEAKDEHKFVVLVFEDDENSIVGREVILDLVDYPNVLVRTMLKKDVEKFGIIQYPSLYIINKDSSFQHLASGTGMVDSDRHRFVDKLLSMMGLFDSEGRRIKVIHKDDTPAADVGGDVVQFQQPSKGDADPHHKGPSTLTGVHMQDLESALHYAFRQEVAICKTVDGAKLDALRNFVSALAKYFPGRAQVSGFLWKVVGYLGSLDKPLTGESWVHDIDSLQNQEAFLPYEVRWVGCRGSQPRYRGYPCSMWTLFHVLTVAAYSKQSGAVNALEVPSAIRGYMEHFFGCSECSNNFLKMASTLEKDVTKPVDAVLWLWAAHNKANKRLHGDESEDPQHPKIQFPSAQDCPACHKAASDSDFVPGWNSSAVLSFLVKFYAKENIIPDAASSTGDAEGSRLHKNKEEMDWWEKKQREADLKKIRELRERKRKQKGLNLALGAQAPAQKLVLEVGEVDYKLQRGDSGFLKNGWGFSQLDFGVCMVFYVTCAAIIVILYYHFIVQRKFKLPCGKYLPL